MPYTLRMTFLIFMVCFISFLGFIGGTIYLAAFPELSETFSTSATLIKFSLTIYFIGLILGTIFSGPLSDTYGKPLILRLFLLLFISSSLLCALSPSIPWFLTGRLLQGIGNAGGPIVVTAAVASQYKGLIYNKIITYILIMFALGPGAAPILGSFILLYFDWRTIFYFLTLSGMLAFGMSFYLKISEDRETRKIVEALREYHFFIKDPTFRYYLLMIGVLYGAFYAFAVTSPYIFRLHYGWSITEFAWVGVAIAIGNSLGSFLNEKLIEKIGSRKVLLTGLTIIALSILMLFLMGTTTHGVWLLILLCLFMVGGNLTSSFLTEKAIKVDIGFTGISSSLVNLSKVTLASLILILVLFLPETIQSVNFFLGVAFLICVLGYIRVRKFL